MRPRHVLPRRRRVLVVAAGALALALTASSCVTLPKLDEALANARRVAETTKLFAADGSFLADLHAEENRENIALEQMPGVVRDAVVAIEDERFYEHPGVDARAIVRAFFRNTNEGRVVEGGSTITQQYVKNVLVEREKTLKRKIDEAALAYQLEKRYSKDQILELYLNTVYFGQGAYGIETAAKTFFGIHAKQLSLPQAALLAGVIRSPARYDPLSDKDAATERRNRVLARMRELGYITAEQEAEAAAAPIVVRPPQRAVRYEAGYFVEWVKQMIERDPRFSMLGGTVGERVNALFKGGLRIYTTIDMRMQRAAEASAREVLSRKSDPYNALVSVDTDTGAVRTMVGGRDFFAVDDPYAKFNLAVQSRRQPGSSFKPFTLVAALEKGISLNKVYRGGSQVSIPLGDGQYWSPRNYESLSFGSSLTVREATIKSVNVVYAQMVRDVGAAAVVEVAKRLGITSPLKPYLSISLGAQEVAPLEMAVAYSAFANGGYRVEPHGVTKITDSTGRVLYEWKPSKTQVLSRRVVERVNEALEGVLRSGTGRRQRMAGREAAGKTGTSDEYHDAWFAGYTRQLATVTWVGFPKAQIPMYPPYTRIRVVGGSWPGRIWKDFMDAAHENVPAMPFADPQAMGDTVFVAVDVSRNCLPNRFTPPNLVERVEFERGSEPTRVCTEPSSPVPVSIPRVIGRAEADARAILEQAGLRVRVAGSGCTGTDGVVCEQSPAPGARAVAGDTVTISVGDQTGEIVVPSVLGQSRTEAVNRLRNAGFDVDYVFARAGSVQPSGCRGGATAPDVVWAQTVCGGRRVQPGTTIVVYVNPID